MSARSEDEGKPLRILGVGDAKSPHFVRWATRLAERGHEVHIVSGRYNPRQGEHDGLVVHQLQDVDPLYRVPFVRRHRMIPALQRVAKEAEPDIVHSHYLLPYGWWTARAGLGPLVVSPWGKDAIVDAWSSPEAEARARTGIASDRALAYVVNSQALEDASVRLGADRAKFHRIFWHARIDNYSPQLADRSRWRDLGWPDDAVVCLSLRYFRPYTNLDVLLRAFAAAREEVPELRLFSTAHGGWTRSEFESLASELGLGPYMAVQDVHRSELPAVTASADFAVSLADVDSSPASMLESMASGLPMIVGRAPSMEEWIQSGAGGEVVERRDVAAVTEAIVKLARDPDLRRSYGERNVRELEARFGDPTAQLEQLYHEVLGR
jgi:glycosyltransferase involved in cell wall biosynthesis